jgi:hypothetical protein
MKLQSLQWTIIMFFVWTILFPWSGDLRYLPLLWMIPLGSFFDFILLPFARKRRSAWRVRASKRAHISDEDEEKREWREFRRQHSSDVLRKRSCNPYTF